MDIVEDYYEDPLGALKREFPEYSEEQLIALWEDYSEALCAGWLVGYSNYSREQFIRLFDTWAIKLP